MQPWGGLVKIVGGPCLYECLKKPTPLDLTAILFAELPKYRGSKDFGAGDIWDKVLVNLYLFIPFIAIPVTLSREVEGNALGFDVGWAAPISGITGRFDGWRPPRQLMTSGSWSVVVEVVQSKMSPLVSLSVT